jgi:hypothetical protein
MLVSYKINTMLAIFHPASDIMTALLQARTRAEIAFLQSKAQVPKAKQKT